MRLAKWALTLFQLGLVAFIFGTYIATIWGADPRWGDTAYAALGVLIFSSVGWMAIILFGGFDGRM